MGSDHQLMLVDAAELGKEGVENLMAEVREALAHATDTERYDLLARLEELGELHAAYDALPQIRAELASESADPRTDMAVAIQLVQNNLRLRQLYADFHDAVADRLFV